MWIVDVGMGARNVSQSLFVFRGDALGDVIGAICTIHVSVPVHSHELNTSFLNWNTSLTVIHDPCHIFVYRSACEASSQTALQADYSCVQPHHIYQPPVNAAGFSWARDVRLYRHQHYISPNTSSATSTSSRYMHWHPYHFSPSARSRTSPELPPKAAARAATTNNSNKSNQQQHSKNSNRSNSCNSAIMATRATTASQQQANNPLPTATKHSSARGDPGGIEPETFWIWSGFGGLCACSLHQYSLHVFFCGGWGGCIFVEHMDCAYEQFHSYNVLHFGLKAHVAIPL